MPPMITAAWLVILHRLAPRQVAGWVGYGILFPMLTLPLWAGMLRGEPLPFVLGQGLSDD